MPLLGSNQSISPAHRAHINNPAATGMLLWAHAGTDKWTDKWKDGQTDRWMDTVPLQRPCSAYYVAGSANNSESPVGRNG